MFNVGIIQNTIFGMGTVINRGSYLSIVIYMRKKQDEEEDIRKRMIVNEYKIVGIFFFSFFWHFFRGETKK